MAPALITRQAHASFTANAASALCRPTFGKLSSLSSPTTRAPLARSWAPAPQPAASSPALPSRPTAMQAFVNPFASLFGAGGGGAAGSAADPRGAELADELVSLAQGTEQGGRASPAARERIAEIVEDLSRYGIKNPARSPLLWGEYEVLYSSRPAGASRQVLEAPGSITNSAEFKSFGLLPGYTRSYGEVEPVSGDTYQVTLTSSETKSGLGGPVEKDVELVSRVRIGYLDANLRIVSTSLPGGDDEDEGETVVVVYRRVGAKAAAKTVQVEEEDEDEDEEEEEEAAPKPAAPRLAFPSFGRTSTTAVSAPTNGTQKLDPAAGKQAREAAAAGKAKEQEAARREGDATRARANQERERAAEERAAEKERQEEAKADERQRSAAIKAQLAQLAEELKEAGADAKEAAAGLRDVERETSAAIKGAAAAEAQMSDMASDIASAEAGLSAAVGARRQAEAALKAALADVTAAEAAVRYTASAR